MTDNLFDNWEVYIECNKCGHQMRAFSETPRDVIKVLLKKAKVNVVKEA